MSYPLVEVTAPSRLHFGMFSFGQASARQFGGVGAMVDAPGLRLRVWPAERFWAEGPLAQRVEALAARLISAGQLTRPPDCRIEVVGAPPEHIGLGTGTQLALAVVAA